MSKSCVDKDNYYNGAIVSYVCNHLVVAKLESENN